MNQSATSFGYPPTLTGSRCCHVPKMLETHSVWKRTKTEGQKLIEDLDLPFSCLSVYLEASPAWTVCLSAWLSLPDLGARQDKLCKATVIFKVKKRRGTRQVGASASAGGPCAAPPPVSTLEPGGSFVALRSFLTRSRPSVLAALWLLPSFPGREAGRAGPLALPARALCRLSPARLEMGWTALVSVSRSPPLLCPSFSPLLTHTLNSLSVFLSGPCCLCVYR